MFYGWCLTGLCLCIPIKGRSLLEINQLLTIYQGAHITYFTTPKNRPIELTNFDAQTQQDIQLNLF